MSASFVNNYPLTLKTGTTPLTAVLGSINVGDLIHLQVGTGNVNTNHVSRNPVLSTGAANWTLITAASKAYTGSGDSNYVATYYGVVTSAGTTPTLTINKTATCQMAAMASLFTGITGTITVDKANILETDNSKTCTSSSSGTLSQAAEIVVGNGTDNFGTGQTYAIGGSWLGATSTINADISMATAYQIVSATTALTFSATLNDATDNTGSIVTYAIPAAGSVGTWPAHSSFAAVGISIRNSVATLSAHGTLAAVGFVPAGTTTATWAPKSTLGAHGAALTKSVAAWVAHGSFAAIGKAISKTIASWVSHASASAIGRAILKSPATFSGQASFTATGAAVRKSPATFAPQSSFGVASKSIAKAAATFGGHASLLPTGAGIAKSHTAITAQVSASFIGKPIAKAVATFATAMHLSLKSDTVNKASFTAHATLFTVGKAISKGAASLSGQASFAAVGKSLSKRHAVWLPQGRIPSEGKAIHKATATLSPKAILNTIGTGVKKGVVNFASAAALNLHGTGVQKSVAVFNPEVTVNIQGKTTRQGFALWISSFIYDARIYIFRPSKKRFIMIPGRQTEFPAKYNKSGY